MSGETGKRPPTRDDSREDHLKALREADKALHETQLSLAFGRARLQRVIARYEERASDPRHG